MTISAQRIVVRFGMSQETPALDIAEMGWDVDLHRLRVGDGSTIPPIIMTSKSLGPYEFNFIDYVQYPEIRMLPDGTVDGVDISDLNAANGFVVRRGDNIWAHRTFTNTDGWLTWTNPAGLANNPVLNLSQSLVTRLDNFLTEVAVDDITIHGNGRPESPLYAHVANATEKGVVELATNAETQQGIDASRAVTPAGLSSRVSTEARTGLIKLATLNDVLNGVGDDTAVSPNYLHQRVSTFTRTGLIRKATLPEVRAGVDTDSAVVPAYLKQSINDYDEIIKEYVKNNSGSWLGYKRSTNLQPDRTSGADGFFTFPNMKDVVFATRERYNPGNGGEQSGGQDPVTSHSFALQGDLSTFETTVGNGVVNYLFMRLATDDIWYMSSGSFVVAVGTKDSEFRFYRWGMPLGSENVKEVYKLNRVKGVG